MAQYVRPIADLDNTGSWSTAPLWSKIDDLVGSGDGDSISKSKPSAATPFTVDGSTVTDPVSSSSHSIRARIKVSAGTYNFVVQLREGYTNEGSQGTLIATLSVSTSSTSFTTAVHLMSGAEADSITDYSDLQFRCYASSISGAAVCSYADVELSVPDVGYGNSVDGVTSANISKVKAVGTASISKIIGT